MEEKKAVKVSLGTVVCIFVIALLIVALGIVYYLGFVKNNQQIIALKDEVNVLKSKNNVSQSEEVEIKTNDNNVTASRNEKTEVKTNNVNSNMTSNANNTKKEFKSENFKLGKYKYFFNSENYVDSFMALEFKDDNTIILVPPHAEDLYLIGTYKIEYREENGIDLPGNIYVIKCTIDKWSADNLNNIEQKAFSPGNAEIIILDEENIMVYTMESIKLREGYSGISFGEGVKFSLEK